MSHECRMHVLRLFCFFFFFLVNLLSVPPMGLQLHNLGRRRKHNFPSSPVSLYVCLGTQSYLTLLRPMDCSPSGSFVHGILQTRILECIAMPSSTGSSQPRDRTQVSCIEGGFFTVRATRYNSFSSTGFKREKRR